MCANGRCYVSQEIIDFSKLDLFEARVLLRFFSCCATLLKPSDLSRKIKGLCLQGIN